MANNYYDSKWDFKSRQEMYNFSKVCENKLAQYLISRCNFTQIIPTRDSIISMAKDNGIILPDLQCTHKNGETYFIELKNKNRRLIMNDNGIDYDKAENYLKAQKEFGFRVLLVFIDDEAEWKSNPNFRHIDSWFKDDGVCTYYGNWIDKLHKETPENPITITKGYGNKRVKCFPLANMKKIKDIFKEKQTKLNCRVVK